MTSVYLASRFARGADLEEFAEEARSFGVVVTSRWHNGSHGDPTIASDINDPAMAGYAADDMADLAAADIVVSFTEGGGGKGGRHVEFGLGLAQSKRMLIVGPREHVFHTAAGVEQVDTWEQALGLLVEAQRAPRPEEVRHFLGVTSRGFRIGIAIGGRFTSTPRPIPIAALKGNLDVADIIDPLLASAGEPLLWPVSAEVYEAFNGPDDDVDDDLPAVSPLSGRTYCGVCGEDDGHAPGCPALAAAETQR